MPRRQKPQPLSLQITAVYSLMTVRFRLVSASGGVDWARASWGGWKGQGLAGLSPPHHSLSFPRDPLAPGHLWSSRVPGYFPRPPAAYGVRTEAKEQRSWRRPRPRGHPLLLLENSIGHRESQGPPKFKRVDMNLYVEGWKELLAVLNVDKLL